MNTHTHTHTYTGPDEAEKWVTVGQKRCNYTHPCLLFGSTHALTHRCTHTHTHTHTHTFCHRFGKYIHVLSFGGVSRLVPLSAG